jgi:hypothetical protein
MKGFIAMLLVMILALAGVVAHMQQRIEALEQADTRLWEGTVVVIDEPVADKFFPEMTADLHNPEMPPSDTPGPYIYEVGLGDLLERMSSDENAIRQAQFEALDNDPNVTPPPD